MIDKLKKKECWGLESREPGTVGAGDFSEGLAPVRVFGEKFLSVHLKGD